MEFSGIAKTDVGQRRTGNEDSFCLAPELNLFVVCDGMGGHAAGEVASRLAVDTIYEAMQKYLAGEDVPLAGEARPDCSRPSNFLLSSIQMANKAIYEKAQGHPDYAGMGTTIVAVLGTDDRMALAHVGDSRIYRVRDGKIAQLTRDHSVIQMQLDRGIITPEEAAESQYRHMITRALGLKDSVEIDLVEEPAAAGDLLLLCSDGLSDLVEAKEMLAKVAGNPGHLAAACQALVDLANERGGVDNITAMLVEVHARGHEKPRQVPPGLEKTTEIRPKPARRRGFFGWLADLWGR
ncbi:MAG: Stp1/IreP family PP2C-type Ser/Thr phosphatase [candidate division NC10 bacterium]|nr:Stp1/IreP family PP2C-type Ser/Thr phosphatase [candidate division NC10 bacterium]